MPLLLQATDFENKNVRILKKDKEELTRFNRLEEVYSEIKILVGDTPELKNKINQEFKKKCEVIRLDYWRKNKEIPEEFKGVKNLDGIQYDQYSTLSTLPKVKLSQLRFLADKFNLVIIPIEYTEIDKIFDTQLNKDELKKAYNCYKNTLSMDKTCEYDKYILCPINYYNIWEQIKSDEIKSIYYPEYFENIFTTIELMIPTQKNLYLATKTNEENLKQISQSFKQNFDALNNKVKLLSEKIDKIEQNTIKEKILQLQWVFIV
ncbi:MAG: hypothetical protein PHE29_08865 [Tissierellia bacterium]|nr:hypothetical protein [Tissierellia bacterium]MDD4779149.1 hypothetical protein [Tissierellia bacterium]